MASARILYVEDEEDYQLLVRRILNKAGLDVDIAETGQEGLAHLRRQRPDLLLLDINLPDTDGYTFCQTLRQDPAWMDLPILMLTVRRRPEEWLRGFSTGTNDYLSKPLNPPELVERVLACLEKKISVPAAPESAEYHLLQAASRGNRAAYDVLVRQYKERLTDAMIPLIPAGVDPEDLIAQSFVRAFQSLKHFRGESSFYTWLYRIGTNECLRAQKRFPGVSIEEFASGDEAILPTALVQEEESLIEGLGEADHGTRVQRALRRVAQPYRQMLELFFVKELSYKDISDQLGVPMGTVMSRLWKARQLLQQAWQRQSRLR